MVSTSYIILEHCEALILCYGKRPILLKGFTSCSSLIKDFMKRPTPEQIMEHPFIVESSKQEVDMKAWIQDVWDFASPAVQSPKVV